MSEREKKRGLAALTPERRREIAQLGGKSVPREKRNFCKNPEAAQRAGSKGGLKTPPEKRFFSLNRDKAKQAGIKSAENRKKIASSKENKETS